MLLFTTVEALRCYLSTRGLEKFSSLSCHNSSVDGRFLISQLGFPGQEVGLVPTMGALHAGHLSLISLAKQQNDLTIVSIFVNPLQFGPNEDFQRYPRQLERDLRLCEEHGVDAVFAPTVAEMGLGATALPKGRSLIATTVVPPEFMTSVLCGRSRLCHFQGVSTIVVKLLNVVQPTRAYFGQKDAQQLAIIKRLVTDLNMPVEIVACRTWREPSGLALSSRNQYLTAEEKEQASVLYSSLRQAQAAFLAGERSSRALVAITKLKLATVPAIQSEYVEIVDCDTLMPLEQVEGVGLLAIAARLGSTRLIDNIILANRQPIVAIDGPAGAGKSTVARQVAEVLGLLYLDTGAMYRAVTWLVLRSGISVDDQPKIAQISSQCRIELRAGEGRQDPVRVWINGEECTQAIRTLEVSSQVSAIAAVGAVRHALVKQQQLWGEKGGIVVEGRDIGTHVFPDAEVKIFLTASVQERARRRQQELRNQGQPDLDLPQMAQKLSERDEKDSNREIAPLRKAPDAIEVVTDGLSIDEVTAQIVGFYLERVKGSG